MDSEPKWQHMLVKTSLNVAEPKVDPNQRFNKVALSPQNKISLKQFREKFFESGISIYSPQLQVVIIKESSDIPKFSVSIGKKVASKAHDRNKLRRQVQQLIQDNLPSFPPYKYLFLPKKTAVDSYPELLNSFTLLLSKLKQFYVIPAKAGIHK